MADPSFLIIRFSSLGDIILSFPVLKNIRKKYPGARITYLTKKAYREAVEASALVNKVEVFDGYLNTLNRLKWENFDYLLDLHSNPRSLILSFFLKARRKTRYRKDALARRLFVNFRLPSCTLEKNTLDRYLETLGEIGIPAGIRFPELKDWRFSREGGIKSGKLSFCIFQTSFLGDCVLTLPAAGKLKKHFPESSIAVLCLPNTKDVFLSSPDIDSIITDDKKGRGSFLPKFLRALKELRKRSFDVAVIPHRSFRSALLAFLAGIPVRIGFSNSAGAFLLTRRVPFSWLLHDSERNLSLLSPVIADFLPEKAGVPRSEHSLPPDISGTSMIGINPGSAWPTKRWPLKNYAEIIRRIYSETGKKTIVIGAPSEKKYNAALSKICGPEKIMDLTGQTEISDLMSLISEMKLFITNDSGPMHIAASFKVPLIAVFGPTTRELGFFPGGENSVVLEEELRCRPCALHGSGKCPRGHFLCMKLITPERMWRHVLATGVFARV